MGTSSTACARGAVILGAVGTVLLAGFGVAKAWDKSGNFSASVHDHSFHKFKAMNEGCNVKFKVYFDAPAAGYSHAEKGRNYYRFRAKVELSEGKTVLSPTFANNEPGKKMYRWTHDSSEEGCWGEKEHKVFHIDVEGCRNRNCKVRDFE